MPNDGVRTQQSDDRPEVPPDNDRFGIAHVGRIEPRAELAGLVLSDGPGNTGGKVLGGQEDFREAAIPIFCHHDPVLPGFCKLYALKQ